MTPRDPEWPITCDRYVGFLDVMGFSAMIAASGDEHAAVYATMRRIHDAAALAERMIAEGDADRQMVSRAEQPGQVRLLQFSDSVLAVTRDASASSSLLIQLTAQLIFLHALGAGVAMRGAIARGVVTADLERSIFFGQPIVEAYRLEQAQAWYGIAFHPSADPPRRAVRELGEDEIPLCEEYAIPAKDGGVLQLAALTWPVFVDRLADLDRLLRPFAGTGSPEAEKLARYHQATAEFADTIWRRHRGSR